MEKLQEFLEEKELLVKKNYEQLMKEEDLKKQKMFLRILNNTVSMVRKAMISYANLQCCGLINAETYIKYNNLFDDFYDEIIDILYQCSLIKEELENKGIDFDNEIKEF